MIPCVDRAQLGHCYLRPPRQLWSGGQHGCSHPSYMSKMPDPHGWELPWAGVDSGKFDRSTHAWAAHGAWSSQRMAAALEREEPKRKYPKRLRWRTQGFLCLSLRSFKHTFRDVLLAQQVTKSSQHLRGKGNQYHLTTGGTVHFFLAIFNTPWDF